MKLTDEQIRMLAESERMMDAGDLPYVRLNGQRVPATKEAMAHFGLVTGQTVNYAIMAAICEYNISLLREVREAIAAKTTDDMMAKITKGRKE